MNGRQIVVLDDRLFDGGAGWTVSWPLCMSDDGTVIACRLTSVETRKGCIAVEGRNGEEFDRVGPPALSADGKHVAYRAHQGDRCFAVVGKQRGPEVDLMTDPAISADGAVVAYAARRGGCWSLVVNGRESDLDRQPAHVFLSADGRSVGYWHFESGAAGSSRVQVVVNGKAGPSFTMVGSPVFSPDGQTVTYAADEGEQQYIVIGDRKVPVSGRASDPVFSPDGRKVGYGARLGREIWWKVLDVQD